MARRDRVIARAEAAGATLCAGPDELAGRAGLVLSAVVSSAAVAAAGGMAPHLRPEHVYLDLNSTSPQVKQEVGRVVEATGANFVEGAVMAAVPSLGLKVPILLCGPPAGEAIARLAPYGIDLEDFGREIGRASAAKMFRSVVVKGLEALLLECALGAERYGVTERVLDYIAAGYPGIDWKRLLEAASHGLKRRFEDAPQPATMTSSGRCASPGCRPTPGPLAGTGAAPACRVGHQFASAS